MAVKSSWKTGNFQRSIMKMRSANRKEVHVGIVKPSMHTRPGRAPVSMALLYTWQEEGTGTKKRPYVPPRPTLIPTFNEYNRLITEWFADDLIRHAFSPRGNITKPFHDVGAEFTKLVKHKILVLSSPAISPYTIRNRVNKGTTNPLVDTGKLMNAISYKVKY